MRHTPSMYSAYKLHTIGSKALQNKDMRSLGHFLFINLYHGFTSYFLLLLDHKSISSSLLVLYQFCAIAVSRWGNVAGSMVQSMPAQATSSQRANRLSWLWRGGLREGERQRKSWRRATLCSWMKGWSARHPLRSCLEGGGWGFRFQLEGLPIGNETARKQLGPGSTSDPAGQWQRQPWPLPHAKWKAPGRQGPGSVFSGLHGIAALVTLSSCQIFPAASIKAGVATGSSTTTNQAIKLPLIKYG